MRYLESSNARRTARASNGGIVSSRFIAANRQAASCHEPVSTTSTTRQSSFCHPRASSTASSPSRRSAARSVAVNTVCASPRLKTGNCGAAAPRL